MVMLLASSICAGAAAGLGDWISAGQALIVWLGWLYVESV